MKPTNTPSILAAAAIAASVNTAFAHGGHGLATAHWHAADASGFALLGAVVALALWLSKRGK